MDGALFPISLTSALLGVASIGILYALHHMKQQSRRRRVATLLFWNASAKAQQSRVLRSPRFKHRKTFLLLTVILLLLAVALTADRWGSVGRVSADVIVMDSGAETGVVNDAGRTLLQQMTESAALEYAHSSVGPTLIAAGPRPESLGREDEPSAAVVRRLVAMSPQAGASASSLALLMADGVLGDRNGRIHWFTSRAEMPADLPERVARRVVLHASRPPDRAAIAGAAFEPAPHDPGRVRLRVRVIGNTTEDMPLTLIARSDSDVIATFPLTLVDGEGSAVVDDLAADGRSITLALQHAGNTASGEAIQVKLPDYRPPTYRFSGDVPPALKLALLTTGIEATVAADTFDIFVASQGTAIPPGAGASIIVVDDGDGIAAGVSLALTGLPVTRGLVLEDAVSAVGPALSDAGVPLISAGRAVAATLDLSTARPTLRLSLALVGPAADFPKHAAFPLLIGRLGEVLTGRSAAPAVIPRSRAAADPLWPGPSDAPAMEAVPIADRPDRAVGTQAEPTVRSGRWAIRWTDAVLIAAAALLCIELLLHAARKIT